MKSFLQGAAAGCGVLLLAIQFIRPARTNPPIVKEQTLEAAVTVSPAARSILERACNDCHSNLTRWPWYSAVAPISWFVIKDVDQGRRHLNFSSWFPSSVDNPVQYTRQRFQAICKAVQSREMPIRSYALLHRRARLSQSDIRTICSEFER